MIELDAGIYSRSNELGLRPPHSVCIIGVGGVGGWVSFLFPLMGLNNIYLVDPDIVEESNLNRLPYKAEHIGMKKVHAMTELIRERRLCNVVPLDMKWEDVPHDIRYSIVADDGSMSMPVIDCRDSIDPLPDVKNTLCTGGYDGSSVTFHTHPVMEDVWGVGEPVRYRTTPSYLVPPVIIASLIINYICYEMWRDLEAGTIKSDATTFDVKNLWQIIQAGSYALEKGMYPPKPVSPETTTETSTETPVKKPRKPRKKKVDVPVTTEESTTPHLLVEDVTVVIGDESQAHPLSSARQESTAQSQTSTEEDIWRV